MNANSIIFKSQVFQAINYDLLGEIRKSKKLFDKCLDYALALGEGEDRDNMLRFLNASKMWLVNYHSSEDRNDISSHDLIIS